MNKLWLTRSVRLAIGSLGIAGTLVTVAPAAQAQGATEAHCQSTPPASVHLQRDARCGFRLECPADSTTFCQWDLQAFGSALIAPGGLTTFFEFTGVNGSFGVGPGDRSCFTSDPVDASCTALAAPSAVPGAVFDVSCVVTDAGLVRTRLVNPAVECRAMPNA